MNLVKSKGKLLLVLILAFIATITLGMLSLGGATTAHAMSGSGTADSPYLISTKADLKDFRDIVLGANGQIRNMSACGKLTADIDLGNEEWEPIGNYSYNYQGTFDGAGYTVSGVKVNKPSASYAGFFGYIKNATIKNLTVSGSVVGSTRVGGIVGQMGYYGNGNSTIYNCTNNCTVFSNYVSDSASAYNQVGGIAGYVYGGGNVISRCTNNGKVSVNSGVFTSQYGYSYAGGIAGEVYNDAIIKNCVNNGAVDGSRTNGGIGGHTGANINIIGCYNTAAIRSLYSDAYPSAETGGIIGYGSGTVISYCGNTGAVTGNGAYNGGIAGTLYSGSVTYSYNTAAVTGKTASGLVNSSSNLTIANSYNTGAVRATSDTTDISAGINGSASHCNISYVYNYGTVTNVSGNAYPHSRRGSISGDVGSDGIVNHTYFLDGTYKNGLGTYEYSNSPYASATKLSAAQMRTQSSFAGWDFENVWIMGANYPVLRHSHDFNCQADEDTNTLTAICERPYCENAGETFELTLFAPTMARERDGGVAAATLDAEQLAAFNAGTGLAVSSDNFIYYSRNGANLTEIGTTAPTTYGDYTVKLTVGGNSVSIDYTIEKLELEFDKDVLLNGETSTTTVSNLNGETAAALLTDEEIERYVNGESVNIYLEVNNESGAVSIPAADKTAAKTAVQNSGAKEGAYLDLSLFKKMGNDADRTAIHEAETAFDVTVDIPSDLLEPYGYTRTYSIVRVHNGVAETLPSTVSNGKISFSTDKFSTYLIAYSDEFDDNGEYIEFTTSIVGDDILYTNDIVANTTTVTVTYKITHNDGFNSILLIPQFDTNVFAIATDGSAYLISINEIALGAAEITPVGDGTVKIVLDNTGDKYAALDGENEFFLTVTYKFIAATAGEYDFGLVLSSNEENGKSEAFYITDANEQKGDQNRVAIRVISNVLTVYERAYIVIGYNDADVPSYQFTFEYEEVTAEQVNELDETTNLIAQYTFNGTATPVIKWYDSQMNELAYEAPIHAGTYYLGISAPQHGIYGAVDEVLRLIVINPKAIVITADDHGHTYGDNPIQLTPTTAGIVDEIEVTFTVKDGENNVIELSSTTDAGTYTIIPSASHPNYTITIVNGTYTVSPREITITAEDKGHVYGEQPADLAPATAGLNNEIEVTFTVKDGDENVIVLSSATNVGEYTIIPFAADSNYIITFENGTYTVTKKALTVTALDQNAEYSGSEPEVDQTAYTVSIDGLTITGVVITKEEGVDVGDYELTIAYSNPNYEITLENGTFTIVSKAEDVDEIKAFFEALEKVYNGANQDLLKVNDLPDYITEYVAEGNVNKNVGQYDIKITVTVDANHNVGVNDAKELVFFLDEQGVITPRPITITADDKTSVYGSTPVELTPTAVTSDVGDSINVTFTVKDGDEVITLTNHTSVGEYDIVPYAADGNYTISFVEGTYTITKAQILDEDGDGTPDDADPSSSNPLSGIKITVTADDTYYNRDLSNSVLVMVGEVTLDSGYSVVITKNAVAVDANDVLDAGTYVITVGLAETDNYNAATKSATFEILKVKLEGVEFTYNHGNVVWTAVGSDIGKTADETGVAAKALKDGTTITYYVYNGDTLIGTYNERTFDAAASTTYKVVAVADNDNYIASESVMVPAYAVTFDEGDHAANPSGIVSDMPAAQYIFEGETVVEPAVNPSVDGCSFAKWNLGDVTYFFTEAVNGDIVIVAVWDEVPYIITIKYLDSSATLGTDVFEIELFYGDTVDYSALGIAPVKASADAGIYYTFANKWTDTENNTYNAVNDTIAGFVVTGDMTFVAVFDTNYNSYTITYYFFNNDTNEYEQYGEEQVVTYNDTIVYRTFNGNDYAWFIKDYWYGNEDRTSAIPVKMPSQNVSVYGAYKFNIGQGDVNADGNVTSDDITLYRQWIVGGYEMTVIASGDEWATVTDANFDATARYYLKRVADNNADESRDIRDVSITRMAIVGGYDWDISTGASVSGQNIDRTKTATSIENIVSGLSEYGRARMYMNVTDTTADIEFNVDGNLYLDLGGKNLTVKSFVLNTNGKNATITVKNGTITTINGITITAPNGNVILEDLIGYVGETQVNLQAATSSLHFAGEVKFFATENNETVPATVVVADGTHVVIEEDANLEVKEIEVESGSISLTNISSVTEIVSVKGTFVENSYVDGKIVADGDETTELRKALSKAGEYTLTRDYDLKKPLIASADVTLNLNGYTLYNTEDIWSDYNWSLISVQSGTLTINGNGSLLAKADDCYALDIQNGAALVINGGTYVGNIHAVYVYNGSLTVNGGEFSVQQKYSAMYPDEYVLNCLDAQYKSGAATITVKGGSFVGFNPEDCRAEGVHTNFVDDEYMAVNDNGTYTVIKAAALIGSTKYATFQEAIAADGEIKLLDDVTLTGEIVVAKAITIDMNGHTVTSAQNAAAFKIMGGTLTLNGNGKVTGNNSVYKTVYFVGSTSQSAVNYSVLNVGSGVEIESVNGYAIMVSQNAKKSYGVVANIEGAINGYYGALYTNGSIAQYAGDVVDNQAIASIATFNVESTAVLTAQNDNAAIYAAGFAKWNVASGSSITGASAIYIKSGYLTIEDGAILNATMTTYATYVNNGNGADVTGDGITIDNTYYPGGNPVVNLGSNLEDTITVAAAGAKKIAVYWYVKNEAQLREALLAGGEIIFGSNITVTGTTKADRLTVTVDTTINLNGKTLKSADGLESSSNWSTLWVNNGAVANITNGTIGACYDTNGIDDAPYGITVGQSEINGTAETVNLTNVNVYGGTTAVYVMRGEANVYGGTYEVSPYVHNDVNDYGYLLNCLDTNYVAGTAVINVYGGTFENFNPADCIAEGANTDFVAEGYNVVENDGIYTVSQN